jgi:hypothetical protein
MPGWSEAPYQAAITAAFEAGQAMSPEQSLAYGLRDEAE